MPRSSKARARLSVERDRRRYSPRQGTVNGTSITASTVVDQSAPTGQPANGTPAPGNGQSRGFFGGVGNFFKSFAHPFRVLNYYRHLVYNRRHGFIILVPSKQPHYGCGCCRTGHNMGYIRKLGHMGPHFMANGVCYRLLGCNSGFFGYDVVVHFRERHQWSDRPRS